MSDKSQETYDLEEVYDDKIAPLMTQILDICKANNLPMFATFAFSHDVDEDDTGFCTSYLAFPGRAPMELVEAKSAVTKRHSSGVMIATITTQETAKKS